jgi:hypothetical protein
MHGENRERWRKLREQAKKEKDPPRLMELIDEINRLLELKESLQQQRQPNASE